MEWHGCLTTNFIAFRFSPNADLNDTTENYESQHKVSLIQTMINDVCTSSTYIEFQFLKHALFFFHKKMFTGCDQDKANITIAHKLLILYMTTVWGFSSR